MQTDSTAKVETAPTAEPQEIPMQIIEPSSVNPDDCDLTIKISAISDSLVEGTIVKIMARGFGFKDYINAGDSREFKLLEEVSGLKSGMLIKGTIRTIGNSRDNIYILRNVEIIK